MNRSHGVNLAGGAGYDNTCLVYADLIRASGSFNGYRGVAPIPAYDASGWPTRVDAKTGTTSLVVGLNANLPIGDYTITAKGKGKIQFNGSFNGQNWCQVAFNGDGLPRVVKLARPGVPYGNQVQLDFLASDPTDPLRDLSFVLPGHLGKTFYQPYLDDLAPFSVLRTMDWQSTNGSKLSAWTDRVHPKFSAVQNGRTSEETAIELANTLHKDLWICIPALASDDYVRQLAELFDRTLEPGRTIYVEYANELWNTFGQTAQLNAERIKVPQWPTEVPAKPGVAAVPVTGGWEYIARRDGHATNLFRASLGPERKCVRVIARQAGYQATLTTAINQYKADGYGFDAISCSTYWYGKAVDITAVTNQYKTDPAGAINKVFAGMDASLIEYPAYWAWWKTQADANRVPLIYYEGGQHLSGAGWDGNDAATPLLTAVNRDPRMGETYRKAINLIPSGSGAICWYNDCGPYSKWGYWGLKERTGQSVSAAPKYAAILADMAENPPPPPPPPPPVEPPPVEPPPPVDPPPVEPPPPPPPVETVPTLSLPATTVLGWLKLIGIDGFVVVSEDGAYTATLSDPRPLGFRTQKLVVPAPPAAPAPDPAPAGIP